MKYENISESLYIKGRIGWKGLKKGEYLKTGDYRIINGSNISNGVIDWSNCGYITKQRYFESPEIMLKKGDILITKDGTIGKVAIVNKLEYPSTIASGLFILRNNAPEKWNTLFLYYYLQTNRFKEFVHSRTEGSVIPHLYQKDFEKLEIPYISLTEQYKISSKLDLIQRKISLNSQINDNLDDLLTLIFEKFAINRKFEKSNLVGIANFKNGLPMQKFQCEKFENGIPVLKIRELSQGYTDSSSDRCSMKINKDYIVKTGDIVFSWSGTLMVKIWSGTTSGLNQHLFKVTSNKFPSWFIYEWTKHYLKKFKLIAAGKATTMGHIKRRDLMDSIVFIPNYKFLSQLTKIMKPIYDERIKIIKQNQHLNCLKKEFLTKYF